MVNNDKKRPNQTEHNEALERLRSWLEIPSAERVLTITALELGEEVRLLQICFLAEDLFHGDRQAARRWLGSPAYSLKGATPLEHARTDRGAKEVETLIGRMTHSERSES
jgi:uncharacterized protein (DUF2384 family)